ncbi:MAG: gephyrin-like molybdotransferase Glp [Promethearchaeota archaeon]
MVEKLRKIGFSKLTFLEDALKKLFSHIKVSPIEVININDSLNRILAKDIISEIDVPPFDKSAMDGYAVIGEDTFGASQKSPKNLKLIGSIEIGESTDKKINKGEAIRISTGAPIPEGSDAVIKIEDTEIENNIIELYMALTPGKNVAKAGEDIKKGTKVLSQGIELKAEHIALLASLGIKIIKVRAKPKISVFASGDELIEIGAPLEPGKIYNSNTSMITNLVKLYGGSIVRGITIKDNKETLKLALKDASKDSEIIIFTGGTSVGSKDYLPEIMQEMGSILTHGIAMRPGSPLLIGKVKESLVFCLPGTPVAAYIGFLVAVGPTIKKMMDCQIIDPRIVIKAILSKDVPTVSIGFTSYLRVKIKMVEDNFIAEPVRLKGSGIISSLTESDGIVEIPPFLEGLKRGEQVLVKLHPK